MIITVTLNPALDYVLRPASFTPGVTNRAPSPALLPGGKGINVSRMLHRLGEKSRALGLCTGVTGGLLLNALRAEGLEPEFIHTLPAGGADVWTRINVKIAPECVEETEVNVSGPTVSADDWQALLVRLRQTVQPGDVLVLSGSVPPGVSARAYGDIMNELPCGQVRVILDTSGQPFSAALPFRPWLVKPNRAELEQAVGHSLPTDGDLIAAAHSLQAMGAGHVLISLAGDGCLLVPSADPFFTRAGRGDPDLRGTCLRMSAIKGRVVSANGAGDSMIAGLLTALSRGWNRERALRYATAAAASTAFSDTLGTRAEADKLFALCALTGDAACREI